jgi:hypothetical protein
MKFTLLLLLALPFAALAQDDPQTVYSKMHKAILAANVGEALKYSTEARRKEIDALPAAQKTATVQMIAKLMPQTYTVASSTIAPDGKTAEVRTSGMAASLMGGKPETSYGLISLVKEKNEWKVDKSEWSNQKPAGMVLVQAAPAPAPAAQAAPAAEKEDVDANEEEAKKARAEEEAAARKKAAEDAAAERQRQKEARMALCVIRPVMSDEQIELCRVAYKD